MRKDLTSVLLRGEIGRYSIWVSTLCETIEGPPEMGGRTKRINSSHSQVGKSSLSSEGDKIYP